MYKLTILSSLEPEAAKNPILLVKKDFIPRIGELILIGNDTGLKRSLKVKNVVYGLTDNGMDCIIIIVENE